MERASDAPVSGPQLLIADRALSFDPAGALIEIAPTGEAAVLIDGGVIRWAGPADQIPAALVPDATLRLPAGATIVPGLVDGHGHLVGLGQALSRLDLRGAASAEAVADQVAAQLARAGEGWILGRGWDQNLWPGGAFPTHAPLTAAAPDRPVALTRVDGHALWVNAAALAAAGITAETPDPPGGRIVRGPDGAPTGVLIDEAVALIRDQMPPPTEGQLRQWTLKAVEACRAVGLTGMHDAGASAAQVEVYRALAAEGALGLRIHVLLDGNDEAIAPLVAAGPAEGEMVQVMGVKLFADGALGSRGAALLAPYTDAPDQRGIAILDGPTLKTLVARYAAAGFQVAVHAIGDAAARAALDAFEALPPDQRRRPRLEHAQVVHPDDQRRMGALQIIASVQPVHATSDMGWAADRLGPTRIKHAYAWRSLLNAGAPMSLGSDFPVESPDPLAGLYAAVTRRSAEGPAWRPEEALSPAEALAGFTLWPAFAGFTEDRRGRVQAGQQADLTVLMGDPTTAAGVAELKVLGVFVAGRPYGSALRASTKTR